MEHTHTFLRFPGGRTKALSFTFDDGCVEDKWIAKRFGELGLSGTFNLNSGLFHQPGTDYDSLDLDVFPVRDIQHRMTAEEAVEALDKPYIEIAGHGLLHCDANLIDDPSEVWDVVADRHNLEKLFHRPVTGYAIPQGAFTDRTLEILKTCGFEYARTAFPTGSFDIPKDMFRFAHTTGINSGNADGLCDQFLNFVPTTGMYDYSSHGAFFCLFAHSYEMNLDKPRIQNRFNDMFEKLAGHDDVWYATNIEVIRYCKAFYSLVYSLDRESVYNPSCMDLWIYRCGGVVKIPAGATVSL